MWTSNILAFVELQWDSFGNKTSSVTKPKYFQYYLKLVFFSVIIATSQQSENRNKILWILNRFRYITFVDLLIFSQ